jgi:hypothetical protein
VARLIVQRDSPVRHIVIITDGVEGQGRTSLSTAMKQLNSVQASVHIISHTVLERQALQTQTKMRSVATAFSATVTRPATRSPTVIRLCPESTRTPSFRSARLMIRYGKRKEWRATREAKRN